MVTIRDVAAEAGVAVSTVSHALNNTAPVKPDTRKRIMEAVQRTNYVPNQAARGLSINRTGTIAFVIQAHLGRVRKDHSEVLDQDISRGVLDAAYECGYRVLVVFENPDGDGGEVLNVARRKVVDGMILTTPRRQNTPYQELERMELPFVVMGRVEGDVQCNSIDIDNIVGGHLATEHLIVVGHQRIGIITPGKANLLLVQDRIEGYRNALVDYGLDYDPLLIREGEQSVECGYEAADYFLSLAVPPTAVFCASDSLAIGMMRAIQDRGLNVPEHMAIVGFDNVLTGAYIRPGLTTINLPVTEIGIEAVKLLLRQTTYPQMKPKRVIANAELVIRESCGGARRLPSSILGDW